MENQTVIVSLAADTFRKEGLRFITDQYSKAFGTSPVDEPTYLFLATIDSSIVGSIGISVWDEKGLGLANLYEFDWDNSPLEVRPEKIFTYGRLAINRDAIPSNLARKISKALIYSAAHYAHQIGRTTGWCEHADSVHRLCLSFGLRFYDVNASLRRERVLEGDRKFYDLNPSVKLYMTETWQWIEALNSNVEMVSTNTFAISSS